MIHGPLKVNCVLKYVHTSHRTVKTGQMVSISDKNRWGALNGPGNMVIMTSVVLMVSRAVPPAPVLWSGAGAPDTGCRVQCRCVPLPQPREAPQPSGSAQTRPGRGKSRSPRPPCRGWWALGKWFWILSQCWNGKRGKQELETEPAETVWTVLTRDQVIESDPVALSRKRLQCPLQVKAEFSRSLLLFSYHLCSSPTLPSDISSCAKADMGCYWLRVLIVWPRDSFWGRGSKIKEL